MFLHLFVGVNCMLDFQMGRHKIKCVPHLHLTFLQSRCTYHSKQSQKVFGSVYMRILLKKRCGIRRHFAKMHFQKNTLCKNVIFKKMHFQKITFRKNILWKSKSESCWTKLSEYMLCPIVNGRSVTVQRKRQEMKLVADQPTSH